MRLRARFRFWRFAWEKAVDFGAPVPVIEWIEERYLASMDLGERARSLGARRALEELTKEVRRHWDGEA